MEPGLYFFMVLVALLAFGLFWFRVLRPMAESFGWLSPYVEESYNEPTVSSVSNDADPHYVTSLQNGSLQYNELPPAGRREEEAYVEAGTPPEAPPVLSAADINHLHEQAREEGAARALGALLGAEIIKEGRSRAMVVLFGPAGRKHTRVKPWIDAAEAAARASREEEAAPGRLVPVNAGRPDEHTIVL